MVQASRGRKPQNMATKPRPARQPAAPPTKLKFIESMECLPVAKLPEGPEWSYEIKLYRLATGVWTKNFAREKMR
jgi:hypothetical protein